MKHKAHKNRWIVTDLSYPGAFFDEGKYFRQIKARKWGEHKKCKGRIVWLSDEDMQMEWTVVGWAKTY